MAEFRGRPDFPWDGGGGPIPATHRDPIWKLPPANGMKGQGSSADGRPKATKATKATMAGGKELECWWCPAPTQRRASSGSRSGVDGSSIWVKRRRAALTSKRWGRSGGNIDIHEQIRLPADFRFKDRPIIRYAVLSKRCTAYQWCDTPRISSAS